MLTICAAHIYNFENDKDFTRGLAVLPPSFSARAQEQKNTRLRSERLSGLLLLSVMLKESGIMSEPELLSLKIAARDGGKPYVTDMPYIDFSISHKGKIAVCALSISSKAGIAAPVGVDAEIINKDATRSASVAGRFFSEAEKAAFERSNNPCEEFSRIWTRKESLLKVRGQGIDKLVFADTDKAGEDTAFTEYRFASGGEKYIITLCCSKSEIPQDELKIVELGKYIL